MRLLNSSKVLALSAALASALAAGCQSAETNTNATANTATGNVNVNSSSPANMTTSTVTTNTGVTIEAKEPDKYSATVVVRAATAGQQSAAGQAEIKVARNGSDRRYSVDTKQLGQGEIIFLDKADKRYLILPARKQYMEITSEMTGFNIDAVRSMTPGQMIAYLQRQQGVERVGEETLNTRAAVKYRVAGRAQTGTQAGTAQGEAFIYVDKETGLPLRIEGFGQSSGNVQGVSGGNLIAEMRDLKTEVDPSQFEIPQGYAQISPEEVRRMQQQFAMILQGVLTFLNQQAGAAANTSTGTAAPTASPSGTR